MRMIFEQDDYEDFFEIVLTDKDIQDVRDSIGVSGGFPLGLFGERGLNLFVRRETDYETSSREYAANQNRKQH